MKTILTTALIIGSLAFGSAQTAQKKTTVRIKKIENVNGVETITDTTIASDDPLLLVSDAKIREALSSISTCTVNGPFHLSDLDKMTGHQQGKDGQQKHVVIITDQITDSDNITTVGGPGKIVDEEIAKVLKDLGMDQGSVEKTVFVNEQHKDDKDGKNTVKVVIVKNIRILDPTAEDARQLGKASGVTDNKLAVEKMDFYPNPNNGRFNLRFHLPQKGTASVSILTVDGKTVYFEQLAAFTGSYDKEIDISQNPKGIYFVKIEQGGHAQLKKIILE